MEDREPPSPQHRRPTTERGDHRAGAGGRLPAAGRRPGTARRCGGPDMSTVVAPRISPPTRSTPTLLALARADARRFARHPLFVFGVLCLALMLGFGNATSSVGVATVEGLVF